MNKLEFLAKLQRGLSGLPQAEIEERLTFYSEMIDDRMEEGLSEEDAVAAAGSAEEIISQTVPSPKSKPQRRLKAWEIVLLVLGSPIWLSLGITAVAVIFALYVSMWAVIVSLWAVFGSLAGCAVGCAAAGIVFICNGSPAQGIAMIAAGIVYAGISIFMFLGCRATTKGMALLTKKFPTWIKRKEAA